jgi:UDP-glucose 4-epimerase
MKYLVTGGCGFIGSHLVEALTAANHSVRILDDLSTGSVAYTPDTAEFILGDVADPGTVEKAMRGVDGCFHLAAVASVERCNLDWLGTHRTNLAGTVAVFDAARKRSTPVIFASSAAVYGTNSDMLTEASHPRPISAYGADKLGCELHGLVAHHVHHVPNCGLRLFNVYGPGQDPQSPYSGVITIFSNRLMNDQTININGDGYHSRDFIYVGDIVNALSVAMKYCHHNDTNEIFNVSTGVDTTIIDLAEEIGVVLGKTPHIKYGPPRPGDPRRSIGCTEKAHRMLGFRAMTNLTVGLAKTLRERVPAYSEVWHERR